MDGHISVTLLVSTNLIAICTYYLSWFYMRVENVAPASEKVANGRNFNCVTYRWKDRFIIKIMTLRNGFYYNPSQNGGI